MAEETAQKRLFRSADTHMIGTARLLHTLLIQDMDAFHAFDSTFTADWAASWQAKIEAVGMHRLDFVHKGEVEVETEKVVDDMEAARAKWTEVKYFVRKAFNGDKVMLRLFGEGAYKKARMSQPKMAEFIKDLHTAAMEHAAALIEAGYSQERIDDIDTIYTQLTQQNSAQNKARRGRPRLTAQRIAALNAPYLDMMQVSEAAQLVFANDPAKRKQYIFMPARKRKKKGGGEEAG